MAHRHIETAHAQDESLALTPGLVFNAPATAPWVNDVQSATLFASNNNYSPSGIRVIQVPLFASNGYLVPSSLKMYFTLNNSNTGAVAFTPINPNPAIFFYRYRLMAGGQQVEDFVDMNRNYLMIHGLFTPPNTKINHAIEGLSITADGTAMSLAQGKRKYVLLRLYLRL